jgi:hypothetical protein
MALAGQDLHRIVSQAPGISDRFQSREASKMGQWTQRTSGQRPEHLDSLPAKPLRDDLFDDRSDYLGSSPSITYAGRRTLVAFGKMT